MTDNEKRTDPVSGVVMLEENLVATGNELLRTKENLRSMHKILCEAVTFAHAIAICELIDNRSGNTSYQEVTIRLESFLDKADRLMGVDAKDPS